MNKFAFSAIIDVLDRLRNQYPKQHLSSLIQLKHVHSLNYFPLLGYAKYGNGVNSKKSAKN